MRKGINICPIDCRKRFREKKIKNMSNRLRFRIWKILHPRRYAKQKAMFGRLDEMHEYIDPNVFKTVYLSERFKNADNYQSP